MTEQLHDSNDESANEFSQQAAEAPPGIVREFWEFLRDNKKWWITPIVLVLLLVSALAILSALGGGAAAPFIYTLF
jgi:hypothetical protein